MLSASKISGSSAASMLAASLAIGGSALSTKAEPSVLRGTVDPSGLVRPNFDWRDHGIVPSGPNQEAMLYGQNLTVDKPTAIFSIAAIMTAADPVTADPAPQFLHGMDYYIVVVPRSQALSVLTDYATLAQRVYPAAQGVQIQDTGITVDFGFVWQQLSVDLSSNPIIVPPGENTLFFIPVSSGAFPIAPVTSIMPDGGPDLRVTPEGGAVDIVGPWNKATVMTVGEVANKWVQVGGGAANVASNWSSSVVPNGRGVNVELTDTGTANNISFSNPTTLGGVYFDSAHAYTLSGPSSITLDGNNGALVAAQQDGHKIEAPLVVNATTHFKGNGHTITATSVTGQAGAVVDSGTLSLASMTLPSLEIGHGAKVALIPSSVAPGVLELNDLTIAAAGASGAAGTLDMADKGLILHYQGSSPYAEYRDALQAGEITTSYSVAGQPLVEALVDNTQLHLSQIWGVTLSDYQQLLFFPTYLGDVNLDGVVNQADYLNMVANMGKTNASMFEGDLNCDGQVTEADFQILQNALGAGSGGAFGQPLGLSYAISADGAQRSVPEPGALAMMGIAACGLLRRRVGH